MNLFQIVILVALVGNTTLGLFVLLSNPRRAVNISFFALTTLMMLWLGAMFACSLQQAEAMVLFWVRQTSAFAALIPIGVFLVRLAIVSPAVTIMQVVSRLRYWLMASLLTVTLCHSPVFVLSARSVSATEMVPPTQYGWGFVLFIAFFVAVIIALSIEFRRAAKRSSGVQRAEIQFLQMGCALSFLAGIVLLSIAELIDNQELSRFVPLSVLALDGFVTYGIATRRIMAVPAVLQRLLAYVLMTVYLVTLYVFAVWAVPFLFVWIIPDTAYLSHLLAALVVAFSVVPAHGWMQTVSHRLFAAADLLNVNVVLEQASQMFQEVSTEANLMEKFSDLVSDSFKATGTVLLLPDPSGAYTQAYPAPSGGQPLRLQPGSATVQLMLRDHEAFTIDMLHRMRPGPLVTGALQEFETLGTALAIGSFMRRELKAILLLSPKRSGHIYDLRDQRTLQLLCDQFAVALENSTLYTTVQNGKIYNDILLDSLTSGIVAVNSECRVTVFNQRAQNLTGLAESVVVNQPMTVLPHPLAECLETVLKTKTGFRDRDLLIRRGDEDLPVRVSSALFCGHTGKLLGALLAFNDMTVLKKMEEQIRRTDRLSSLGTLSAGMAHEIKNPLVTIKTFAQLLPQQHDDPEFRSTFFELVGQEVKRIDAIVNRLLNFARPAKASLKPVSLHEIIENSLRLVEQQLAQHAITLNRQLDSKRYIIEADAEQLNQTFINFFLNAIQAMKKGGTLTVRTAQVLPAPEAPPSDAGRIHVDIQDTGCGVAPENLSKIFDPFFTTKEEGVGLGLSVSHGIIQEHNGTIDVESEPGKGTVFRVQFPLVNPQEKKDA